MYVICDDLNAVFLRNPFSFIVKRQCRQHFSEIQSHVILSFAGTCFIIIISFPRIILELSRYAELCGISGSQIVGR